MKNRKASKINQKEHFSQKDVIINNHFIIFVWLGKLAE